MVWPLVDLPPAARLLLPTDYRYFPHKVFPIEVRQLLARFRQGLPQNSGPPGDKAFSIAMSAVLLPVLTGDHQRVIFPSTRRPLMVWFGAGMSAASARFIHAHRAA